MKRKLFKAPVLIVGAHRSGTSIVTQMLRTLGLFIGHPARCDHNAESQFFLFWHEYYLRECGASWHQPEKLLEHLETPDGRRRCRDALRYALDGRWGGAQSLLRRYAGRSGAAAMLRGGCWGWKDPRTTLFAPVWLEIFRDAKILHVLRHPLDAALSLQARQNALEDSAAMTHAPQMEDLKAALHLVQTYVERGVALRSIGNRYHQVHYEALQHTPHAALRELAAFCELPMTRDFPARLQYAASQMESAGHARRREYSQSARDLLWNDYPSELRFEYS